MGSKAGWDFSDCATFSGPAAHVPHPLWVPAQSARRSWGTPPKGTQGSRVAWPGELGRAREETLEGTLSSLRHRGPRDCPGYLCIHRGPQMLPRAPRLLGNELPGRPQAASQLTDVAR